MADLLYARIANNEQVELLRPNEIIIKEDGEEKAGIYTMQKAASKYLYKQLGVSPSTSKELFKLNEPIWKQLIEYQLSEKDGKKPPFTFNDRDVRYIVDKHSNLIDAVKLSDDYVDEFQNKLNVFLDELNSLEHTHKFYTEGTGGLIKIIAYRESADLVNDKFTPAVILEVNNDKAEYVVYSGIVVYNNSLVVIPSMSPITSYQSFVDFIWNLNILGTIDVADENAEELYEAYQDFKSSKVEISVRELTRILGNVGFKLELSEDLSIDDVSKLEDEESNIKIKDFFNSFKTLTGETAEDILNLSEIKKVFKYNTLTLVDVLEILSKEYMDNNSTAKVTASALSDLVYRLYTKHTDKADTSGIRKEFN